MASGNKGVGVQVACLVYSRLGQMQLVNTVYAATTGGQHSGKKKKKKGVEGEGTWDKGLGGIYRYVAWGD